MIKLTVIPEDQEEKMLALLESDYVESSDTVRDLATLDIARSLQELTERRLKRGQGGDYILRIRERDGFFDLIVLKRIN